MKIIYVTAALPYGPTEVFAIPEVRELTRRGHDLLLVPANRYDNHIHSDAEAFLPFTRYEPVLSKTVLKTAAPELLRAPLTALGATLKTLPGQRRRVIAKNAGSLPKSLWLAKLAREWGAHHIHSYWASVSATTAMIAAEASHTPWSFTAHRWDITRPNAFRVKTESARFVRFISEDGLELARPVAGPRLTEKAQLIRMGVPLSDQPLRPTPLPEGVHLRLVCAASLIERKGHRFLLEAVRQLSDEGITVQVYLAGSGEEKGRLSAQAERLGVAEQIIFLGNVDHTKLLGDYSAGLYDAFILPSLHEGISVALIEAMSRGLPVIATDVGGTRELLTGETGQLIPAEDVGAIVRAVRTFAQDKNARQAQAKAGRDKAIAEYDIIKVVDALEALFAANLKKGARGA